MTVMYLPVVTRKAQECHLKISFSCWQTVLHIYYIIIILVGFVVVCCDDITILGARDKQPPAVSRQWSATSLRLCKSLQFQVSSQLVARLLYCLL